MKVNSVSFSAGRFYGKPVSNSNSKHSQIYREPKPRPADIIPISGLIGISLVSAYLMHKGQLDMFIKGIRF